MQVICLFSLDGEDWQRKPFEMSEKVSKELRIFIAKHIKLNEKVEFKKGVGTFHDLRKAPFGKIVLDDGNDYY